MKEIAIIRNIDFIIERALKDQTIKMYYQPIYSAQKKRFTSAEALLRLTDEEYGYISPALLISAAERSGAIHYIFFRFCIKR